MKLLLTILLLTACAKVEEVDPKPSDRLGEVQSLHFERIAEARQLQSKDGWLLPTDCDGMHWSGKAAAGGLSDFNPSAAEESGRFYRRPKPYCWTEEGGDKGSKTTWSRDAAIIGLFPFLWRTKNLEALERHAEYGKDHNWKMGEPFADGRVVYTPQVLKILYSTIYALGGADTGYRRGPSIYPTGLDDYQAHLQMMDIWITSDINKSLDLGIRNPMYDRVVEHSTREPEDVFYQVMLGRFTGDMSKAISICLNRDMPVSGYVRCHESKRCQLAQYIFSCSLVLEAFDYDYKG